MVLRSRSSSLSTDLRLGIVDWHSEEKAVPGVGMRLLRRHGILDNDLAAYASTSGQPFPIPCPNERSLQPVNTESRFDVIQQNELKVARGAAEGMSVL